MKTPTTRLELGKDFGYKTEGGEDVYVIVPRSVTEGFTYELGMIGSGDKKEDTTSQANNTRLTQLKVLELVQGWNVDDETGAPLPLLKDIVDKDAEKQFAKRVAVLQTIPVEVTKAIVDRVTASVRVNPRVEAF